MKCSKSEEGQQAFKARSALFSARQRSAFILFDGVKSTEQVLAATAGLGITQSDVDHLIQQGFLLVVPEAVAPIAPVVANTGPAAEPATLGSSGRTPQERYRDSMPLATQVTASLGLRGFRLNLAVEAASGFEDLLALLPRIQEAAGSKACVALAKALKD
jgi:hypothetical protein